MANKQPHLGGHYDFTSMLKPTLDLIKQKYDIKSMIDIGCGPGGMVEYANHIGIYSIGVDGDETIKNNKEYIHIHDYTLGEYNSTESFDLAYSTEFLEHVEEKYIKNFISTFKQAKYIWCTAAVPGQPGHHHVNCKPKDYWIDRFNEYGLEYKKDISDEISKTSDADLVAKNSMFFINHDMAAKEFFKSNDYKTPFTITDELIETNTNLFIAQGGSYK